MSDLVFGFLFGLGAVLPLPPLDTRSAQRILLLVQGVGIAALLVVLGISLLGQSWLFAQFAFRIGKGSILILGGAIVCEAIRHFVRLNTGVFVRGRGSNHLLWGARAVMASYFAYTGTSYLLYRAQAYRFFQQSGYSYGFFIFIACAESAGALGLLLSPITRWAAIALAIEMMGAVYTHYHNHFAFGAPHPFSNSLDPLKMIPVLIFIAENVEDDGWRTLRGGQDLSLMNIVQCLRI